MRDPSNTHPVLKGRAIRTVEVDADRLSGHGAAIEDIYADRLDAIVIREAFPEEVVARFARRLHSRDLPWLRPNRKLPGGDIAVLGVGAAPTRETPGGPSMDTYLESAESYPQVIADCFGAGFDPVQRFQGLLGRISGGRPTEVPRTSEGRSWIPCTLRSLEEGQQIYPHHDYHFPLPVYAGLAPGLDTSLGLSYFVTLRAARGGGQLIVYGLRREDPEVPLLPNGFVDGKALAEGFHKKVFEMGEGDLVVFGSGRCFHQVTPVIGSQPRITLGGFLAFDRDRTRVLFWS